MPRKIKKAQSGHTEGVPKSVGKPSSFLKRNDCPAANLFHGTQRFSSNFVGFLLSSKMRKMMGNDIKTYKKISYHWLDKRRDQFYSYNIVRDCHFDHFKTSVVKVRQHSSYSPIKSVNIFA